MNILIKKKKEKLIKLKAIVELTQEIKGLFENNKEQEDINEKLLSFLEKRQDIIKEIDIINEQISFEGEAQDIPIDTEMQELLQEEYALLKEIKEIDAKNQGFLNEAIKALTAKVEQVRDNKKAHKAYSQDISQDESWFFDKKT